jgi:hypothetical protein
MNNIIFIKNKYDFLCNKKSDINEHLPILFKYSTECESIIECGVRNCVSTWAFVYGLLNNNKQLKKILINDINCCNINELLENTHSLNIDVKYEWISNIDLNITENYDLVFIDTWHVYGQLKRELNKFGNITNKYIIMHDTTIDEISSESVRNKHDIDKKMEEFGFTFYEVTTGLKQAIDEFLINNTQWKLHEKFTNNNGLTILKNINYVNLTNEVIN